MDDTQRNLLGQLGIGLALAVALTWVPFGPGELGSVERIVPAVAALLLGVILLLLAWRRRSRTQEPDGGGSSVPSAVTINQAPGSGGPAFGINPRVETAETR